MGNYFYYLTIEFECFHNFLSLFKIYFSRINWNIWENVKKILDYKKSYLPDQILFKILNLKMDSMKRILRYKENVMTDLGCHGSTPKMRNIEMLDTKIKMTEKIISNFKEEKGLK